MKTLHQLISAKRVERLRVQGLCGFSDSEVSAHAFGNRFAPAVCSLVLLIAVPLANIPLLGAMMVIAFFGVLLPNHPFDYVFNNGIRQMINKPQLPPRSKQFKFACISATVWLMAVIYMFLAGHMVTGYVLGGLLVSSALLVSSTDICIPSIIYNFIFNEKCEIGGKSYSHGV